MKIRKKIISVVSVFLFAVGICIAQSSNPSDYKLEDIYIYYGNLDELGVRSYDSLGYTFKNEPNFAEESENFFIALRNKKIVPLASISNTITVPVTIEFQKEKEMSISGYICKEYSISEEDSIYDEAIKEIVGRILVSTYLLANYPSFLTDYANDDRPVGTKFVCETTAFIDGREIQGIDLKPFSFKETYLDARKRQKKRNRTILMMFAEKPSFKIANEGTVVSVALPEREKIETPFGMMEVYKSDMNLKTDIPSKISIGRTSSIFDKKDYKNEQAILVKNETELKALYQTRKGYELRNDICGSTCGAYIKELDGEFYMGSIHLACGDDAWTSVHAEAVKKSYISNLVIDLRFIDGKVVFTIAPQDLDF